jgi:ABC-type branched-subunit amino acid transport system substrate-binding protein
MNMSTSTQVTKTTATKRIERVYTASDCLAEVFKTYAKASEAKRRAVFISRARDDDAVAMQIIGNWFDRYKYAYEPKPAKSQAVVQQRAAERDAVVAKVVAQVRQVVLLDMTAPNGKKLRDLTGRECGQIGGWFGKLAAKVKATQKVGSVLSEGEVRKLWSAVS